MALEGPIRPLRALMTPHGQGLNKVLIRANLRGLKKIQEVQGAPRGNPPKTRQNPLGKARGRARRPKGGLEGAGRTPPSHSKV